MKNLQSHPTRSDGPNRFLAAFLAAILFAVLLQDAAAATKTWDGSSSGNWNIAANWTNNAVPVDGDDLLFPAGAANLTNTNNISGLTLKKITFSGGNFVLRSNAITLTSFSAIVANSGTNTIEFPINLDGGFSIKEFGCYFAGASLTLNGNINLGNTLLQVYTESASGNITFGAVISGTGGISKDGPGTLIYSGSVPNTYSLNTVVYSGVLQLSKSVPDAISDGEIYLGTGSTAAIIRYTTSDQINSSVPITFRLDSHLDLNNQSDTVGPLYFLGKGGTVTTGSGTLTLTAGVLLSYYGTVSGTGSISGKLALGAANRTFTINNLDTKEGTLTISAAISGSVNLTKDGPGELVLTASNSYSGTTTVSGGTLLVNGSQPQSPVTVGVSGTLGGTGTVGVIIGDGNVAPGASPGMLTSSNLTFSSTGDYFVDLTGPTAGTDYDQLNVRGTNNLANAVLHVTPAFVGPVFLGDRYTIIKNDDVEAIAGTFTGLAEGDEFSSGGFTFRISYAGGSGNDVVLTVTDGAQATELYFTNALGGDFLNAFNWSPNFVPRSVDNANFTNNATYQVTWSDSRTNANAFFNASSGTVTQAIGSFAWLLTNSYVIGQNAGSTATVTHASGTLRVTNSAGTAALDVRRGTNGFNDGLIDADLLLLTNSAGRFEFNGGTLITRGGTIANGSAFRVGAAGSTPAVWDVRVGGDTVLSSSLTIGLNVPGSQLLLTNGGKLFNTSGTIGTSSNASGSSAFVAGAGSVWSNSSTLSVGSSGSFNQLVVSNGGKVFNQLGIIGSAGTANSNAVIVTGAGSVWSNSSIVGFAIGNQGSFNQLVVSNGGAVFSTFGKIGANPGGNNNAVFIVGADSVWSESSTLRVGDDGGSFNQLVISNGGTVLNPDGIIGDLSTAKSNAVVVAGAGAVWTNSNELTVGNSGSFSQLVISNGGAVFSRYGYIGRDSSGKSNAVFIAGAGSVWSNSLSLYVGLDGSFNQLMVSNAGAVFCSDGDIGFNSSSDSNSVFIVGTGSIWSSRGSLTVGNDGSFNQLVVSNGGAVFCRELILGADILNSAGNRTVVDGGTLRVTNASTTAALDIRRGTNQLNSGLVEADRLRVVFTQGQFEFDGGTLSTKNTTNSNGRVFTVGNGVTPATLSLIGNGTIIGILTNESGGTLAPGASVGKIVLSNPPLLQGMVLMEISKTGLALTNDQIQVSGTLTYGGTLSVANISPAGLTAGDRFPLFSASSYGGAFSSITLPPLGSGLAWTNKLLLDGSIEVVAAAVFHPQFSSLSLSGTNFLVSGTGGPANGTYYVLASTDVALPLANWTPVLTNQFDGSGNFAFTNAISPAVPQRFYVLQVP